MKRDKRASTATMKEIRDSNLGQSVQKIKG